jgi:SAM-dependent methyltransferase
MGAERHENTGGGLRRGSCDRTAQRHLSLCQNHRHRQNPAPWAPVGSRDKVRFIRCNVQKIAATEPGQYDLVVLCDVLHHVPVAFRQELLDAIRATLAPGGAFVLKEWERTSTPIHWLGYASDRWVTGDRIHYMTRDEARERLARGFGETALVAEARFAPWRNNIAALVRP